MQKVNVWWYRSRSDIKVWEMVDEEGSDGVRVSAARQHESQIGAYGLTAAAQLLQKLRGQERELERKEIFGNW